MLKQSYSSLPPWRHHVFWRRMLMILSVSKKSANPTEKQLIIVSLTFGVAVLQQMTLIKQLKKETNISLERPSKHINGTMILPSIQEQARGIPRRLALFQGLHHLLLRDNMLSVGFMRLMNFYWVRVSLM